ncbi:MAG TPA: protein kinase [Crinalium sp.]|jgi:serine/threonine-protein kinase
MEVYCTRPNCPRPVNYFADLDNSATLKTVQQKYCTTCGMPLLLIGRYVPLRLLGKGGFGTAFLARDRYTPAMRQCVVKQFQPSGDLTPSQLQIAQGLFEREGAVLEELGNSHPQIPDLLAFFELEVPSTLAGRSDRFFYLVQEFIDGQNLEEELAQKGAFSEADVREVLTEILKVLKYVHDHGSIHRDIKPSNIMRRRDGRLYLLDFGAVKQVTSGAATPGGKASTGIYSMGFAPPEQMAGNVVYPATDLYALGVTCITLLTGKQPSDLYDAYSNGWNWRGFAQVSDRLEAILNRMLLATPSERFQSADETLDALNAPSRPTPTPSPTPATSSQPSASQGQAPSSSTRKRSRQPKAAVTPSPSPAVQPAPTPSPVNVPAVAPPAKPAFSLLEWMGGAAFTGFEGGLLAIALLSVVGTSLVSASFWVILVGILVVTQARRIIEKVDLLIIAGVTVAIILLVPGLRDFWLLQKLGSPIEALLMVAILAALVAVVVMLFFRLVYKLLSSLF